MVLNTLKILKKMKKLKKKVMVILMILMMKVHNVKIKNLMYQLKVIQLIKHWRYFKKKNNLKKEN